MNVCFCCVRFSFSIPSQSLAWGTFPKWPILCRVGLKTTTQSVEMFITAHMWQLYFHCSLHTGGQMADSEWLCCRRSRGTWRIDVTTMSCCYSFSSSLLKIRWCSKLTATLHSLTPLKSLRKTLQTRYSGTALHCIPAIVVIVVIH